MSLVNSILSCLSWNKIFVVVNFCQSWFWHRSAILQKQTFLLGWAIKWECLFRSKNCTRPRYQKKAKLLKKNCVKLFSDQKAERLKISHIYSLKKFLLAATRVLVWREVGPSFYFRLPAMRPLSCQKRRRKQIVTPPKNMLLTWHTLISKDTSGSTPNTLLMRNSILL